VPVSEVSAFLTVPEVASIIGASSERTYGLIASGAIPHVRFGRRVRVPRGAFDRWIENLNREALAATVGKGSVGGPAA
jgi:excisionase family DNA binding protein